MQDWHPTVFHFMLSCLQFEIRERDKKQREEYRLAHPDEPIELKPSIKQRYIEEFLPPPEPE